MGAPLGVKFTNKEFIMEQISVVIPKSLENLKLPDPELVQCYKDIEERIIYLEGYIGGETDPTDDNSMGIAKRIIQYNREDKLIEPEERKPIKIFIDSGGGDAYGTVTLVNTIVMSKTPVYTINLRDALSAAGYVFMSGHRRFAFPGSTVLIHSGSVGYSGDKDKVDAMRKHYDKITKTLDDLIVRRTKIDAKTLRAKSSREWFMGVDDMIKHGVADQIVTSLEEVL